MAQSKYPCDTVKFVVPYPPGGASDPMARMLMPSMSRRLGTNIVVENVAGAGGSIGVSHVANAKPDGCTWLLGGSSAVIIGRNLFKHAKDPLESLIPVAQVAATPMVLYVNAQLPVKTVDELVTLLQENPTKYSYASPGSGTMHHLLMEQFKQRKKVAASHVPYRGSGPAIQDVLAGHVAFSFEATSAIIPHLRTGKVRALATTGDSRSVGLPDVPTMKELGLSELTVSNWYALFVPRGTPSAIVDELNKGVREAEETREVAETLSKMDSLASTQSAAQFQQAVNADAPRWERLVKTLGLKVE
jgi:tripartite-type tricarboxylate transporter receptor subunit TctC